MRDYKVRLRPQCDTKRGIYRFRNLYGNYDWQPIKNYTSRHGGLKRPLNEEFTGGVIFARIHYLTSHAPEAVNKRWKQANARWDRKMCSFKFRRTQSIRFLNKYTVNRWL